MTKREQEQLEKLLLKKEQEEKADAEFFKQVRKRKADVIKELGIKENQEPAYNWFDEYNELNQLCERLMIVANREYTVDNFRQYVEWREQKKIEQAGSVQ